MFIHGHVMKFEKQCELKSVCHIGIRSSDCRCQIQHTLTQLLLIMLWGFPSPEQFANVPVNQLFLCGAKCVDLVSFGWGQGGEKRIMQISWWSMMVMNQLYQFNTCKSCFIKFCQLTFGLYESSSYSSLQTMNGTQIEQNRTLDIRFKSLAPFVFLYVVIFPQY